MNTYAITAFLAILPYALFAQVTFIVNAVPAVTPPGDTIFIAGNFQGWDPGNAAYMLQKNQASGNYSITLSGLSGLIEFKFTRGSWARVEGDANGNYIPNRQHNVTAGHDTLYLQILGWEDLSGGGGQSTAAPNVSILTDSFYIPQLNRYRRIWIYLPPDYASSGLNYSVLYMQDGQNVFDALTSFAGEWEVDETLNDLHAQGDTGIIVVAIDNGQSHRFNEYSPWYNPNYGGGEGVAFTNFIVNTLKPFIDSAYRTLPDRENTGIMGSSLGALISLYAGITFQDIFSKVGSFSPAYWFNPEIFTHVSTTGKQENMRFYQVCGGLEGANMVTNMNAMENELGNAGFGSGEIMNLVKADGEHSEWFWAREFHDAYMWLFHNNPASRKDLLPANPQLLVYPNPAKGTAWLSLSNAEIYHNSGRINLYSISGQLVKTYPLSSGNRTQRINTNLFGSGLYLISLVLDNGRTFHGKLIVE